MSDESIRKSEDATTEALTVMRAAARSCREAAEAMAKSGLPNMGRMIQRIGAAGTICDVVESDIRSRLSQWPDDPLGHRRVKGIDIDFLIRAAAMLGARGEINLAAEIVGAVHALETSPS
jgi:hypothetical protein